jgi:hypothetical protein
VLELSEPRAPMGQQFGHWRRTRPFWASRFLIGSGLVILVPTYATLHLGDLVISISTLGGATALIIGVMLIVIEISVWIRPQLRLPAGIAAGLLALASLPTANLLCGVPSIVGAS